MAFSIIALCALMICPLQGQTIEDAYVDPGARELVRLARLRRNTVDTRIQAYQTVARERRIIRLRSGMVEKILLGRDVSAEVDWRRDGPARIAVLSAKEITPMLTPEVHLPLSMSTVIPSLAFDPVRPERLILFDSTVIRHPFSEGSEAYYRYQSGGPVEINLASGRAVRMHELIVIPRQRDPRLITGSFWLDDETHATVRAFFKLARKYDGDRDQALLADLAQHIGITADDGKPDGGQVNLPGILKPVSADMEFISVEYGLYDDRWWLPRQVSWRAVVQVGRFTFPATLERTYSDYTVTGDTTSAFTTRTDSTSEVCRTRVRYAGGSAKIDSTRQARADSARVRYDRHVAAGYVRFKPDCEREVVIAAAADSVLMNSTVGESGDFTEDFALVSANDLEEVLGRVANLPKLPCCASTPVFEWGPFGAGLLRYNKVEALSIGARMTAEVTTTSALTAQVQMGVADRTPRGELAVNLASPNIQKHFAAYRRLTATNPTPGTHGTLASLGALLLGNDDDDYFNAIGAEMRLRPGVARQQWYDLRVYAEKQRAVAKNTDVVSNRSWG